MPCDGASRSTSFLRCASHAASCAWRHPAGRRSTSSAHSISSAPRTSCFGTMGREPGYVPGGRRRGARCRHVMARPGARGHRPYTSVIGEIDTLIVGSFDEPDVARRDRRLIAWLRRTARHSRRVVALCSGVVPARGSWSPQRSARDDALDVLCGTRQALSARDARSRADLRPRSRRLHVRRGHGERRSRAGPRRGGLRSARGAVGGPPHGALPQAPVRPGAAERAAVGRARGAGRPARPAVAGSSSTSRRTWVFPRSPVGSR